MDFFTHLLVGIALGRLLFKDKNKQKAIALGSILPDFDILLAWIPSLIPQLYLFSHRGIIHSVITLLIVFPLVVVVLNKLSTYHRLQLFQDEIAIKITLSTYVIGVMGSYLHLFMDLLNPQGVVLFSPISEQRFTLSTMNFIEPAVSIPAALIVLFYTYKKYFKKQSINFIRFDIYSRVVGIVFVAFIVLNSFLLVQTVSTQDTNITTPSYLFTERWVIINHNDTYTVKLVNQFSQQTIREFSFDKITYNLTLLSSNLKNQLLDSASKTNKYKNYMFTLDPDSRTITTITKGSEPNQWVIEFIDIIAQAQQMYYNLPNNSFFHDSIKIKISIS